MVDKLMYFPNVNTLKITLSVDYNYKFKRLNTQLNKPTNQNPPQFGPTSKVAKPLNKKMLS